MANMYIDNVVSRKVDKIEGKGLSTNDYTTTEKNKLSGIEANANNYIHPTTSGNKHIPSGGSSGKILGWAGDGTALWIDSATEINLSNYSTPAEGTSTTIGANDAIQTAVGKLDRQSSDLTQLESEDRIAISEIVDNGEKNILNMSRYNVPYVHNQVTFTIDSDGALVCNGTANGDAVLTLAQVGFLDVSDKVVYMKSNENSGLNSWFFDIYDAGWTNREKCQNGTKVVYKETKSTTGIWRLIIPSGKQCNNLKIYPMLCSKADFAISDTYAKPFIDRTKLRLSNQCISNNLTVFNFDITPYNASAKDRFRYGLLIGGTSAGNPLLFHIFINTSNQVTLTKILGESTFTASITNTTLTVTGNATVYGGLRLIWLD